MKAIITIGISASGKTFWAKEFIKNFGLASFGWKIISRDDCRRKLLETRLSRKLEDGELWKIWKFGKDEKIINEMVDDEIHWAVEDQKNIILADTNLNEKFRNQLIQKLKTLGFEVEIKGFPITLEEAWARDARRVDGVGHSVIYRQWQQWNEYLGREKYVPDVSRPLAVICDIDGTLAHMNGKRGPFEWDKVGVDEVDPVVKSVIKGFKDQQYQIIILSGRDGVCQKETRAWLHLNDIPFDYFWMRTQDDMRKDSIIKEDLFWAHIADNFNVKCVIDDRPQVVRLWHDLGLKVLNVGNSWIEF